VEPFSASFLRFVVDSFFLILLAGKRKESFPLLKKNQLMPAILLGMTGIFTYNVFFFMGLKTVTASRASLIVATNPVFISLFSVLLFKERMNAGKVMGIILCLAGAAIVISHGNLPKIFRGKLGWGEVYILGCVASWVAYSLIGKVIMKDLSPLHAVTYSCLIGTLALFFPAWQEGIYEQVMTYTAIDWTGIFYLGFFGTVLGFLWYYEGIQVIGPSRAAVFINFVPVSGVLLGWLLLDESINLSLLTGAALVIGGVYLTNKIKNT
jgi:drug/metabolite transporter (DMT)-like permease